MDNITILVGQDLRNFYAALGVKVPANVYQVRVTAADGQVKVKKNADMWTYGMGKKDQS